MMSEEARERLDVFMAKPSPILEHMKKQDALRTQLLFEHGPDYEKPVRNFNINKAELAVIDAWVESLKPEIMKLQGKSSPFKDGEPYYGAVGGGLTYSFIPTGLGDILTVTETTTGKNLNVSDALEWIFYG